jgi:uncharacterized protein YcbK (DUF882 family)
MKLTRNFSKSEFDSKDGALMPSKVLHNIKILAEQLQELRDYLNKPITINSGYRSPKHNRASNGVRNSQHVLGTAADISVEGLSSKKVHEAIEILIMDKAMLQGGVGLYPNFVHYDVRIKKARW